MKGNIEEAINNNGVLHAKDKRKKKSLKDCISQKYQSFLYLLVLWESN